MSLIDSISTLVLDNAVIGEERAGGLIVAVCSYLRDGEMPKFSDEVVRAFFLTILPEMDKARSAKEAHRRCGRLGGRKKPNGTKCNQMVSSKNQMVSEGTFSEEEKVTDSSKENKSQLIDNELVTRGNSSNTLSISNKNQMEPNGSCEKPNGFLGGEKEEKESSSLFPETLISTQEREEKKENITEVISKKTEKPDLSFIEDKGMLAAMETWLSYKREKKQSYKGKTSLQTCYKKLLQLSEGDSARAMEVVEQSIANNYSGLFALKAQAQPQRREVSSRQGVALDVNTRYNEQYEGF